MLESARFRLLIHHDDDEREYAYENGAAKILAIAKEKNYIIASMKTTGSRFLGERQARITCYG
jgi:hypothetical protein